VPDNSDIQAAVDALAAELGCPVLVEDARHQPLWWSAQDAVDDVRMRTILQRAVAPEASAMVRRLKLAKADGPVRTPELPEIGMRERLCVPIRSDRSHLGYLWVLDGDHHVGENLFPRLQECADLVVGALARMKSTTADLERQRSTLLDRLLRSTDDQAARELTGLERLPHDVLVVVRAPASSGGWALPGDMSAHVWTSRSAPAASGPALPLVDLRESVRRAAAVVRAVAAGAALERRTWDALGAWRLVVEAPDSVSVAEIHPGAEALAARSRSDLMTTARAVLDHGGDVTTAAESLHIHRTTLYYRLDRIADLIGVDLRDGAGRTDLQLALWLAAYRQAGADT
jgi:hypothetical protein